MIPLLAAGLVFTALTVFGARAILTMRHRARIWAEILDPLFGMAGYTELIVDNPIDEARGIEPADSKVGLFKENRDISFYWFGRNGRVTHANTFRLNNIGLFSHKDYRLERQPGEYRIVVLGDEMTAATTVEVSWPDRLQDLLCANAALLRHLRRTQVSVLNFGWPDAGFSHLARVWQDKAKAADPDLVMVNVADYDFHRYDAGTRLFFRGRPNTEWRHEYVTYTSPGGLQAWLVVICVGEGRDLKSPDSTCARPFALYLTKELAENPKELAAVQGQIVRDYLSGGESEPAGLNEWVRLFRKVERKSEERRLEARLRRREWDVVPGTPLSDAELLTHARTYLRAILDNHPNVLITQNPLLFQAMDQSARFQMTEALVQSDPGIKVVDTRTYLPLEADGDEIQSWYQVPHAPEKWSAKGHEVYAHAQARLIVDRLAPALRTDTARVPAVARPAARNDRVQEAPAETKSVGAQPVETQPVETKPVEENPRLRGNGIPAGERRVRVSAVLRPMNRSFTATVRWAWRYRRLVWQQTKERLGLASGHARVDDGRDWAGPSIGLMNPIYTLRAIPGVRAWIWRHRRLLWQRVKEKVGLSRGHSRWDDGRDWVTPVFGPMNPVWSLRVILRRLVGKSRSQSDR